MMKVLKQATRVHCFAEEVCDETTKADWQLCAYQRYQWQMSQEVGHLYALFGGPEEDEVRVKGQRLTKAWMDKATDSVEEARRCMGLRLQGTSELDGAGCATTTGRPQRAGPVRRRPGPPFSGRSCLEEGTQAHQRALRRAPRQRGRSSRRLSAGGGTGRRL
jgi:hypothetical protein